MAQLSSPGVSVTVIDESFYTPAAPGTVPLIIVASGENKANSAGTGIAPGTLKANAGTVYLLTSQMDLGNTFGIPYFQTDAENNPVHAGEINEYGLQAAYSFLGVSNRAYVVRADLDTQQLKASANAPAGAPADGALWLDTLSTLFGIFEWNAAPANATGGQTFTNQVPTVITDTAKVVNFTGGDYTPKASVGAIGDYAIVAVTNLYKLWYKKTGGTWVEVGSTNWISSRPTYVGGTGTGSFVTGGSLKINGNTITDSAGTPTKTTLVALINANSALQTAGITASLSIAGNVQLFSTGVTITVADTSSGSSNLAASGLVAGVYKAPELAIAPHTLPPQFKTTGTDPRPTGSIWIKTTTPNMGASYAVKTYNANTKAWVEQVAPLYYTATAAITGLDPTGGGLNIAAGTAYVNYDQTQANLADFQVFVRSATGPTVVNSTGFGSLTGSISFTMSESLIGGTTLVNSQVISVMATGSAGDADTLAAAINAAGFTNIVASTVTVGSKEQVVLTHVLGGEIGIVDHGSPAVHVSAIFGASNNVYVAPTGGYVASLWTSQASNGSAVITAGPDAPSAEPADGTLWYNSVVDEVDILVHNGTTWVGYLNFDQHTGVVDANNVTSSTTDPNGPIVSATQPTTQSDGTPLANGDLWISTADLETYPAIYKYNFITKAWVLLDNTDQTSENGVLFADARWNEDGLTADQGAIVDLLSSNFLDFDAPDPALFPKGMLLWNLRRSGNNVLRYVHNYVDPTVHNLRQGGASQSAYFVDKWVSDAPNTEKGVGQFGRHAQRAVVLKALNALIEGNQQIRDEDSRVFNLISCPGYLETLPQLNALNADRGLLSFVVADSPARLTPDATSLANWGNNVNGATGDGEEGLVSTDPYSAVYYPWGYTTDLLGNNIVVPPSHIMLRTIALSDNVSYPWFAPAGTRRGGVTNVSSVGYVDPMTGEFNTVALNNGQRDTLAAINVNPITYIGGIGLVAYGQKTRQLVASAMDRINVVRLVIYLRYQLNAIAKPYIFEPNDTITRNEIKQQVEKLMLELTGERALYDYLVVCDTSNNTPSRIDANELYVDIAIEPVKAVEFIYIPLRLENTGAIKGLGK